MQDCALFCVTAVEELWLSMSLFLRSCVGQASTESLRPCLSQSDIKAKIRAYLTEVENRIQTCLGHPLACWADEIRFE